MNLISIQFHRKVIHILAGNLSSIQLVSGYQNTCFDMFQWGSYASVGGVGGGGVFSVSASFSNYVHFRE